MGGLRCLDGSALAVVPVAARDRRGLAYEVTLELRRDGDLFGRVGERCGYFLGDLARRLAVARADDSPQALAWPDPDDRFPDPADERWISGPGTGCEPELFAFRYRDRGDLASTGELRCSVRTSAAWVGPHRSPDGRWRLARRAVVEAWGAGGRGVRAVLTAGQLAEFLAELLAEADRLGPTVGHN
ncbi:hypothetical protein [Actinomadura oligospora]|uniref:hypothetical protein n=1 Tax=Actinomadura oligospora TaxID=111804 RepID=UPI00047DB0D8|nr:hypothetical protein [Actinomadura oligospora]